MKKTEFKKIEIRRSKHNFTLVIFGASGSLAKLKLFPAIYELAQEGRLPKDYTIVGYARTPMTDAEFRTFFSKSIKKEIEHVDEAILKNLLEHLHYFSGQYDDIDSYKSFQAHLTTLEKSKKRVRLAYLSVPPSAFDDIFRGLHKVDFSTELSRLRLIIEKPFGYDLRSAKKLKRHLERNFKPEQVYLLDHYLGKEAVSNLLSLRYANSILTNLLNKQHVSNVQISALESKDIEGRTNYFDNVGILRDMVQSHLLQILAYFAMAAPKATTAEAIHHEKARVLNSIMVEKGSSVVRGQYEGYGKEPGIAKGSCTETYAALKLKVGHPHWKGVPFYMRSGKALSQKWTGVVIEFKPNSVHHKKLPPNRVVIQLQPTEKIEFHLLTKLGGKTFDFHDLITGRPIYCSGDCLSEHGSLLLDAIAGKKGLFLNFEEIFAAWKVIDPIQKECEKRRIKVGKPQRYKKGSLGPKLADEMIKKDGFEWFNPS